MPDRDTVFQDRVIEILQGIERTRQAGGDLNLRQRAIAEWSSDDGWLGSKWSGGLKKSEWLKIRQAYEAFENVPVDPEATVDEVRAARIAGMPSAKVYDVSGYSQMNEADKKRVNQKLQNLNLLKPRTDTAEGERQQAILDIAHEGLSPEQRRIRIQQMEDDQNLEAGMPSIEEEKAAIFELVNQWRVIDGNPAAESVDDFNASDMSAYNKLVGAAEERVAEARKAGIFPVAKTGKGEYSDAWTVVYEDAPEKKTYGRKSLNELSLEVTGKSYASLSEEQQGQVREEDNARLISDNTPSRARIKGIRPGVGNEVITREELQKNGLVSANWGIADWEGGTKVSPFGTSYNRDLYVAPNRTQEEIAEIRRRESDPYPNLTHDQLRNGFLDGTLRPDLVEDSWFKKSEGYFQTKGTNARDMWTLLSTRTVKDPDSGRIIITGTPEQANVYKRANAQIQEQIGLAEQARSGKMADAAYTNTQARMGISQTDWTRALARVRNAGGDTSDIDEVYRNVVRSVDTGGGGGEYGADIPFMQTPTERLQQSARFQQALASARGEAPPRIGSPAMAQDLDRGVYEGGGIFDRGVSPTNVVYSGTPFEEAVDARRRRLEIPDPSDPDLGYPVEGLGLDAESMRQLEMRRRIEEDTTAGRRYNIWNQFLAGTGLQDRLGPGAYQALGQSFNPLSSAWTIAQLGMGAPSGTDPYTGFRGFLRNPYTPVAEGGINLAAIPGMAAGAGQSALSLRTPSWDDLRSGLRNIFTREEGMPFANRAALERLVPDVQQAQSVIRDIASTRFGGRLGDWYSGQVLNNFNRFLGQNPDISGPEALRAYAQMADPVGTVPGLRARADIPTWNF
jgi:hypothetical protein